MRIYHTTYIFIYIEMLLGISQRWQLNRKLDIGIDRNDKGETLHLDLNWMSWPEDKATYTHKQTVNTHTHKSKHAHARKRSDTHTNANTQPNTHTHKKTHTQAKIDKHTVFYLEEIDGKIDKQIYIYIYIYISLIYM